MVDDRQIRRIRKAVTPLYVQIVENCDQIIAGVYPPEQQLPSETSLTRNFGVSRVTVRQALAELESTGFYPQASRKGYVRLSGTHVRQQFSSGAQTIVEALPVVGTDFRRLRTCERNVQIGDVLVVCRSDARVRQQFGSHGKLAMQDQPLLAMEDLCEIDACLADDSSRREHHRHRGNCLQPGAFEEGAHAIRVDRVPCQY
ncbi:hypothetical protein CQ13_28775 [Bradyrhizobium retamae]|uniref:HTH gntR-type domain-containing protein n=1 Tax=Bradyrhizobium retamae TaxID=1300035 RepID=A0A0R3MRY0_9BRAD|nr:GntR family transcriptional regulator [Bradyrhizobium retamae]KRR22602.1 hypothetical protein CQ13_28775 [Bradyrhizobium retamae]